MLDAASIDPIDFTDPWDAVVIGGGFFGCTIATMLKIEFGLTNVLVVEREDEILTRASYGNQARIHNGYHYPRSFTTAFRSRVNFPRFVERYSDCIDDTFLKIYGIARFNSLVAPRQFERFCREIGAPCQAVSGPLLKLFNPRLVEAIYQVTEFAFDANALARKIRQEMVAADIRLLTGTLVRQVRSSTDGLAVHLEIYGGDTAERRAHRVFNCTYAGLNRLGPQFGAVKSRLKYEITEIALLDVPPPLKELGITIMDGPFFSCMPFPPADCHSLSHVRYTPHLAWLDEDEPERHPYEVLESYEKASRVRYMIADAARYVPILSEASYDRSIFEVKTVLMSNEVDDGRPILFERHDRLPETYSILGGKIDNIFDIEDAVRRNFAEVSHPVQKTT